MCGKVELLADRGVVEFDSTTRVMGVVRAQVLVIGVDGMCVPLGSAFRWHGRL